MARSHVWLGWVADWITVITFGDRLTRGPSGKVNQVLMAHVKERDRIQRAGWSTDGRAADGDGVTVTAL